MRNFLTPAEEAVYGRFTGPPEQAVLERGRGTRGDRVVEPADARRVLQSLP